MTLHWHTEPLLLASLLGIGWLYALATGPWRHLVAGATAAGPWRLWETIYFYSGLGLVYLAVGSPLDQIGEQFLFSAHMLQHIVLIYVAPPLLFAGVPGWLCDRALSWRGARAVWRALVHPVVAGALFTLIYTGWHVPWLYEAALRDKTIHIIEHATIFFAAIPMWWPVLSRSAWLPPRAYGVRAVYVFALMVAQIPLFGFLSFAPRPLYATYEWAPRIFEDWLPLSPLEDQIAGGILMKVTNMLVTLVVAGWVFWQWYEKDRARNGQSLPESVPVFATSDSETRLGKPHRIE